MSPWIDPFYLHGRVVLVTGASGGIGRAVCAAIEARGGIAVRSDLNGDAETGTLPLDVTSEGSWHNSLQQIEADYGRLDGLVNNAGVCLIDDVEAESFERWRKIHAVNLDGTFLGCKLAMPLLREGGARSGQGASIVNVCSVSGLVGGRKLAAYNSSKGAVRLLTKSVALHGAKFDPPIRCNSLHPAFIDTGMIDEFQKPGMDHEGVKDRLAGEVPLRRVGTVEEVAHATVFLLSAASGFTTGSELVMDGGLTAQ